MKLVGFPLLLVSHRYFVGKVVRSLLLKIEVLCKFSICICYVMQVFDGSLTLGRLMME